MKEIMEKYSTTFFECVQEWPDNIKKDIYKLYAYLRAMDEIVEHNVFHPEWTQICKEFEEVENKYSFDKQWSKDFVNNPPDLKRSRIKNVILVILSAIITLSI